MKLFYICFCECPITKEQVFCGKALCSFKYESNVCLLEIKFLLDQRSEPKMIIGWSRAMAPKVRVVEGQKMGHIKVIQI